MTNIETKKFSQPFRHGERVCYGCGVNFDPNWQTCQRCGCSRPVEKDDYNPISLAAKKAEALKK